MLEEREREFGEGAFFLFFSLRSFMLWPSLAPISIRLKCEAGGFPCMYPYHTARKTSNIRICVA